MNNKLSIGSIALVVFLGFSLNSVALKPAKAMVTTVELGQINPKMVAEGKGLYTSKCVMCHDLKQNKIGPALMNVTKERKPEYIMNVILNTPTMQKNDPTFKALVSKFKNVPMPDPNLSQAQARALLEYLRSVAK